jgi:hypothetical protein
MSAGAIDFCGERDLPELMARFAEWYRYNPRLQERTYFDWQFRDTPTRLADAEYDFLVLRNDAGEIAGCLGFCGFEFRLGSEIRVGGWTHNWMAPNQGNAGLQLLWRFMKLVDNRVLLRLNEKSGGIVKLLQVPMLSAMPRWWAVIDANLAAAHFDIPEADDRRRLAESAQLFHRAIGGGELQRAHRFADEEEFGLDHLGVVAGLARRTGRYLNWRYRDIPAHNYRLLRSGRAFGAYRIEPVMGAEISVIRLLEWTFDHHETGRALATVLADAAPYNPVLIDFHTTFAPLGAVLQQAGFLPQTATAMPMPDLFRPTFHSGGYPVAIDLPPHRLRRSVPFDQWYITSGDSDIDRVKL